MKTASAISQLVIDRLRESIQVKEAILEDERLMDSVAEVGRICTESLERGGKIILFGNGGSAADAQHIAAEFVGKFLKSRRALAAIALNTNSSVLTAIGNDYCYEEVFSRQIEALGCPGDIAIGISTSGNSGNVIRALDSAKQRDMITAGMTGGSGGKLISETDYCLCVPSVETPRIQEAHIALGHIICEIVENHFSDECNPARS